MEKKEFIITGNVKMSSSFKLKVKASSAEEAKLLVKNELVIYTKIESDQEIQFVDLEDNIEQINIDDPKK